MSLGRSIIKWLAVKSVMLHPVIRWLIRAIIASLAIFVVPFTFIINIKRNKKCPPPTDPLLFYSATKLAELIRTKQIKSEDVVKAYINRCKEVNSVLNAIVEPRYDVALKEARNIDKLIESTDKTPDELAKDFPLLGIPITIKESLALEGMSNDAGCKKPKRIPASEDAAVVKLARAAGAIPIAVTNTPQLCMNWETYNQVTGITRNPYCTNKTSGGSSGGEAALLGSAASLVGIGSDIAGSLRLPAMFCGVYGHKPTPRIVSTEGHNPGCTDPCWDDYFAVGPMTRYAEDITLMLRVLAGDNINRLHLDSEVDLKKLKFYYIEEDKSLITNKIGVDMKRAMNKVKQHIKTTYGVEPQKLQFKHMEHIWEISTRILIGINNIENIYTNPEKPDEWISVWPEVLKKLCGMSNSQFTCVFYGPLKKIVDALPKNNKRQIWDMYDAIQADISEQLKDDSILIYPTFIDTAHVHYRTYYKFLNFSYLTIFNIFGLPVTNCPVGLTSSGMPVGVQLVSNKGNDHLTIALAKELEKTFGGWIPPNTVQTVSS